MDRDTLTLKDALLGGPGLNGYAYNAVLYCVDCGRKQIERAFEEKAVGEGILYPDASDSDVVPQPVFFGESDSAEHCDDCGEYLYCGKRYGDHPSACPCVREAGHADNHVCVHGLPWNDSDYALLAERKV